MLESALTSNAFVVSQMLATHFPSNLLVKLLGYVGADGGISAPPRYWGYHVLYEPAADDQGGNFPPHSPYSLHYASRCILTLDSEP